MSHKATMWAIQQRGIRPAAKLVLWHLCDRYHPDNGCFPSQETLADDCELSRSSLNDQLDALETAGLIRREQRRDGATYRQQSTLYRFAFEPDFAAEPCPNSGLGAMSENHPEPCPNSAESRVRNSDTNLVREPVIEPVKRERAQEDFEKARRAWPSGFVDNRKAALDAWADLTAEERRDAAAEISRYVNSVKSIGRSHLPAFSRYLRDKGWIGLEPREKPIAEVRQPPQPAAAPPSKPTNAMLDRPDLYADRIAAWEAWNAGQAQASEAKP